MLTSPDPTAGSPKIHEPPVAVFSGAPPGAPRSTPMTRPSFIVTQSGLFGTLTRRYTDAEGVPRVVIRCGGPPGWLEEVPAGECKQLRAPDETEALDEAREWLQQHPPD